MLRPGVAFTALLAFAWAKDPLPVQLQAAAFKQEEATTVTAGQGSEIEDEGEDGHEDEEEEEEEDEGQVEDKVSNADADVGLSAVEIDEVGEEEVDEADKDEDEGEDEYEYEDEDEDEDEVAGEVADEGTLVSFFQLHQDMQPVQSWAGVWQNNAQTPAWKVLQQQLMGQYSREQLAHYTAVTVPATLVYAMSAQEQTILEPARRDGKGELNIHLIGSTYFYEGLSDWKILAWASPPDFHTVNVHLILGTPFGPDGTVQDKNGETIHFDNDLSAEQVKLQPNFLQISPKKYGAKELRSKTCRSFTHGSTTVNVHCHEKLYQNVMNEISTPHLAFMSNPGFPLPYRRFYDGVLTHLLEKSIPSVISAQQAYERNKMEELVAAKGDRHAWSIVTAAMNDHQWNDEAYQCAETVKSYGASVSLQASPFPYAYYDGIWVVKNAVVEFFSGQVAGASKIELLAPLKNDMDDKDTDADSEFVSSLHVPVSRPFAQAMRTWAQHNAKGCVDAQTVKDWVTCCKAANC